MVGQVVPSPHVSVSEVRHLPRVGQLLCPSGDALQHCMSQILAALSLLSGQPSGERPVGRR